MSIAVFRLDYVTKCAASTSVRFDRKEARNRQLHIFAERCSNVEERLLRHNSGATPSTKPYRPWKVVYTESFENKSDALKRELQIKKMKSRKYIETLLSMGSSAG